VCCFQTLAFVIAFKSNDSCFSQFVKYEFEVFLKLHLHDQWRTKAVKPTNNAVMIWSLKVFWDVVPCSHAIHRSDDGGSMHLWNIGRLQHDYMVLHPRRLNFMVQSPRYSFSNLPAIFLERLWLFVWFSWCSRVACIPWQCTCLLTSETS
jgi:hypothetical protein